MKKTIAALLLSAAVLATAAIADFRPGDTHGHTVVPKPPVERTAVRAPTMFTARADQFVLIDGDTLQFHGERLRLKGPDSPESWHPRCDNELIAALAAKEELRSLLGHGEIAIQRDGTDKYGRTLVYLWRDDGREVGELLIESGKAVPWSPGRASWLARAQHWCPGFTE